MSDSSNVDWIRLAWNDEAPEVVRRAIESGLDNIRKGLESLRGLDIKSLAIGGGAILLGGPVLGPILAGPSVALLQDRLNDNIESALNTLAEVAAQIRAYLKDIGNPWKLNHVAGVWSSAIGQEVSEEAGWYDIAQMPLTYEWTGDARDAYVDLLPGQKAALSKVAEIAIGLNQPLTACASHVIQFWTDIGLTVARTLADIAAALDNAATPDILSTPIEAVSALVKGVTEAIDVIRDAMANFMSAIAELEDKLHENDAFPGGRWPIPDTIVGDASQWNPEG